MVIKSDCREKTKIKMEFEKEVSKDQVLHITWWELKPALPQMSQHLRFLFEECQVKFRKVQLLHTNEANGKKLFNFDAVSHPCF